GSYNKAAGILLQYTFWQFLTPISSSFVRNPGLALVTLQGRENEPKIQQLNKLLVHPNVKDFINKEYKGRIIPVF
ncbi:MAG: hypothetical protein V7K96_25065, partial [Nostoc sp.]